MDLLVRALSGVEGPAKVVSLGDIQERGTVVEKLKVAAAIVKETFAHPLKASVIRVEGGEVRIDRGTASSAPDSDTVGSSTAP